MGALINVLVLIVFLLVGLAQTHSIPIGLGYGIAIPLAIVTFALAVMRYKGRKDRGE